MLFWLLRSFFPVDFSARLLRTSTFPVMHSLLPSGTTKTDNLEEEDEEEERRRREEGSPDLTVFFSLLLK